MLGKIYRSGFFVALLIGFILPAHAGEYTVFGPERFERGTGKPVTETSTFSSPVIGTDFTLKIRSGDEEGKGRISAGAVTLNGTPAAGPADFNQQVGAIERQVALETANDLSVDLGSKPGAFLTLSISGIDNDPPQVAIDAPTDGFVTEAESIDFSGTVVDETPVTVSVNGLPATLDGETFSLSGIDLEVGENVITVSATDLGANTTTASVTIVRQSPQAKIEPQPEGSFGAQYEDLIPADATKTEYDPRRFSLITGEVKDLDNQPVPDVSVSVGANSCVQCHGLEYGSVKTDAEGRFTIPVEGGSTMTVAYDKPGLITSHRQVYVPWNDWAVAEAIQMIPEDTAATVVTFDGNPETVVTHRSTPVTDEFGTRSATLVFTGDNKAYEVDAGGNVIRKLSLITTRATEFITPESMPANLPPTSAYTYCAELSVDGAERVRFEKPVILWVDNFLGFDIGSVVPVGYYDRDRGAWVPSDDGIVVLLLDTDGDGVVDGLDSDGDNFPDDLNGNGSFEDEVDGLENSAEYRPGITFWRASVTHFTPYDLNWPPGFPPDAIPPNPEGEPDVDQQADDEEKPCDKSEINSFVEDRNRIYHEDIIIPGTDMTLHYASNRVEGYKAKITVPVSGLSVPGSLKGIVVQAKIAGKTYVKDLPPSPNQKVEFIWDGLDWQGTPVSGSVTAHIWIGFVYELVYYIPCESSRTFGSVGCSATIIPGRVDKILGRNMEKIIDIDDSGEKGKGFWAEGWTLSDHHYVSPSDLGTLFKGDGKKIKARSARIITTVAGTSGYYGWGGPGDGGPADQASLYAPGGIAVDAAGNLYIADSSNNRVRKVDAAGIITTVAGNGSRGYVGDGGPAVEASLSYPLGVAVDAAGNLYIGDRGNYRIRKVDANGIITTVAGNGSRGYGGDGGLAVEAALSLISDLAVDNTGNLYIADYGNYRVRKVDVAGIITTIAGNGSYGFSGDGGLAVQAAVYGPYGLAVDAAGNLYIGDRGNHRIRKVDANGIITTVAGNGSPGYGGDGGPAVQARIKNPSGVALDTVGNLYFGDVGNQRIRKVDFAGIITTITGDGSYAFGGDGGPAVKAKINVPSYISLDPTGNLYFSDSANNRVRKVGPISAFAKASTSADDIFFIEDNSLGHILSNAGLHKKTIDLNTGITLRIFDYDTNGNLNTITDQFGKVTTIRRDVNGVPTSIVAPDGLTTQLAIDVINHLTAITYPAGTSYNFEYTFDGLMTAETDPNGNRFEHVFDSIGRLTDVTDPEGGHWNYTRDTYPDGSIQVKKTTGEGNTTTYLDRTDSTGAYTSTITGPSGGGSTFTRSADGLTETSDLSCGMEVVSKYDLDPEYKFKYVKELTESTPAGRKRLTLRSKTYQDTDADKVPDQITETITLNGKATTLLHDVLQAKKEVTSPAGRKVTSFYDPANLLTKRLSVSGLYDVAYAYDGKGRLTALGQGERQSSFAYTDKGFLSSVTDPESRTTTYDHDAMGRVTAVHRPDGSAVGFTYDNNGNMTVLTNPSSVAHGFDYNGVDYKTGYQTPQSGSYRYLYDKDRRLVETRFPSGRQIINFYDKDRLASISTPEGEITLSYLCATKLGSMSKGGEKLSYTYDGKLVTSETASGTMNQTLSYAYNNDFNATGFTYAGGTVNYTYDSDGLLTGAGGFTIARNAANGLPESVAGGSFSLGRTFNGYGEIEGEMTAIGEAGRYAYSLTRSPAGRITSKTETVGGESINYAYTYDEAGRLATVTKDSQLVEQYQYDSVGRRTYEMNPLRGIAGRSFAYSNEDHLLTAGDVTYQYNLDGFLTSKTQGTDVTTYNYSSRGELLKVVLPDGKTVEYVHDPQGSRIAKKVNGVVAEKYLWQGLTRLLAVYDGNNNLLMRFQYADGRMPVAMTKGGAIYYLGYDQVGSLRMVIDAAGNLVKRIDLDSFGSIFADSAPAFTVPFGFAGGLEDQDTGLVRFGYRDYDPEIGRWTAKDPIGFAGGDVDLYGYCLKDPINFIDPNGQFAGIIIGAISGAYTGATAGLANGNVGSAVIGGIIGGVVGGAVGAILPAASSTASGAFYGAVAGWWGGAAGGGATAALDANNPCASAGDVAKATLDGALGGGLTGAMMGAGGGGFSGAAVTVGAGEAVAGVTGEMIMAPISTGVSINW